MKKILTLLLFLFCYVLMSQAFAQRFLTDTFPNISITNDLAYATNITIITGGPTLDTLNYDIYKPLGDTMQKRPIVIVLPTSDFIPQPFNGRPTGSRKDTAMVDICKKLAGRGFVAFAVEYRLGWTPTASAQDDRTGSWLNALYRGIQDTRTMVRYLRDKVHNHGNPDSLDPDCVFLMGMGTGANVALGTGYLDSYDEINLAKFLDTQGVSFVDTSLSGDLEGKLSRPLNVGNYPNENSNVQFIMNMGGAIADSSWIEVGEPPVVSVHVPSDPFEPYDFGPKIVPTTGQFVVNLSGSRGVQRRASMLGINQITDTMSFLDPVSIHAATVSGGLKNLFPLIRPTPEAAPWEYWDSTYWLNIPAPGPGNFHETGLLTNPDMSRTKSRTYEDSILIFFITRGVCGKGLRQWYGTGYDEREQLIFSVSPNPSETSVNISLMQEGLLIERIVITDLTGHAIRTISALSSNSYLLDHRDFPKGIYVLRVETRGSILTRKVCFQ